ncbi:hypothetical protein K504DRAFT_509041 [Pleomassaria siparia CBS 279.74]|uniref:Uncharacterized protein n=1 Tax=Pleomassaria siparia CBS 279.74 TaxID=1314801 RepID=A0A6G1JP59_9PLEO|nr:hypothetical protein K504DRAFT_509041 [Pleomassaria siparia CBS 279.74]
MPPRATLNLRPRDVTADKDQADVLDKFQPAEAFFARSPDDALQWICCQTSHVNMLWVVKEAYKELDREADKTLGIGETASQEALRVQRQGNDMVVLASPDNQDKDEAGLTAFKTESFAYRWKMDGLYEEFNRLEKEIKRRSEGTRGRGVRYADTAKEHLFASTYRKYLGRVATKGTDRELWLAFGDYLDWGRRWNALKKRFGSVGIFGILP